jgi:hypothetical protein
MEIADDRLERRRLDSPASSGEANEIAEFPRSMRWELRDAARVERLTAVVYFSLPGCFGRASARRNWRKWGDF